MTIIIDGSNLILGRLASYAAKKAILREDVVIVNCENVYISGSKLSVKAQYKEKYNRGNPSYGPFQPKMADRMVRRTIRGMLPYKELRGKEAFKKVKCFLGVPVEYKNEKLETLKAANVSKLSTINYISLKDLSKYLGSKN